jgi:hypothetical protein
MPPTFRRIVRSRPFLIAAAALLVYATVGFLLLPYLIERNIPVYAQEQLQRRASVGNVRVNPFLLRVEAEDFHLQEADGRTIAGFRRLLVDFEISSLFRWAWTFADIRLAGLDLHFVIEKDGRSNLARLADAFPRDEQPQPASPAPVRMLLQHIRLEDGKLTFIDGSLQTPASVTLTPIELELRELSTLPERNGPYAVIASLPAGGRLVWRGEMSLHPLSADGELYIKAFRPAALWNFLQERFNLGPPEGDVELYTRYRYARAEGQPQFDLHGTFLNITGLVLRGAGRQDSLLVLERFSARDGRFDLAKRELAFPEVLLSQGQVAAVLAEDGTLDWQRLARPGRPAEAATEADAAAPDTAPWTIRLESLGLDGIGVRFSDMSRVQPVNLAVGQLGARAQVTAAVGSGTPALRADGLEIRLAKIALTQAERAEPLVALDSLALSGGRVDTRERALGAQLLTLSGAAADLVFDADDRLVLVKALTGRGAARSAESAGSSGNPWRMRLDRLQATDSRVALTGTRYRPPLRYDLEKLSATVEKLGNEAAQAANFSVEAQVAQGGAIAASGSFAPDGSCAEAAVKADKLSLKPLKSLVGHFTTLTLQSGDASLATQLSYARGEAAPALRINGAASIDGLLLDETATGGRFLSWNSLATRDLDFSLSPDHLTFKQLRVVRPGAKIQIFEDRSVNLGKILKPAPDSVPREPAQAAAAATKSAARNEPFPVSVERVRIEKGDVDFSDMSLVLPFSAEIADLAGTVTGISSDPASRANVSLEGRVDEYGSVQVEGGLSPFAPKEYTDIRTRFRNIEMKPLSPYTATFAGRKVAAGKLSLDLEYKVKDGQLAGDNKVVLDHFTLGQNVDSPDALDLPLDLAIGLLTDSRGRINVAVPVRGDVDSPTFSFGKLVGQAIVGMLGKIVTAPFRALGGLLGGGGKDPDSVAFDAGSAQLQPPQIETLVKVADALRQRPQLRLAVSGRYDPQLDGAALRAAHVRRELAEALDIRFEADEEPPPVAVDHAESQRELEKLFEARAGGDAVDDFRAGFERTAGRSAEPVNPALALFGKASPDVDYYQAMYARLVELHPLEDSELQALAEQRAAAIVRALVEQAGLDANRVAPGRIEAASGSAEARSVDSKLLLEAGAVTADAAASPPDTTDVQEGSPVPDR